MSTKPRFKSGQIGETELKIGERNNVWASYDGEYITLRYCGNLIDLDRSAADDLERYLAAVKAQRAIGSQAG